MEGIGEGGWVSRDEKSECLHCIGIGEGGGSGINGNVGGGRRRAN